MSTSVFPVWLMLPIWCVVAAKSLGWIVNKTTGDRRLRRLVFVSYWVRVLLAAALFAISYWRLPLLQSLQSGEGFWIFGIDAQAYHAIGQRLATFWHGGGGGAMTWPEDNFSLAYTLIVAVIYWFVGAYLPFVMVFNAWCGAICGLLAYLIAQRCLGERAKLPAALFVAFWPSSILWSAQPLKDASTWCASLSALYLSIRWCQEAAQPGAPRSASRRLWSWVGLVLAVIYVHQLRAYAAFSLLAATGIVGGASAAMAIRARRFREGVQLAGLMATVLLAVQLSILPKPLIASLVREQRSAAQHATDVAPVAQESVSPITHPEEKRAPPLLLSMEKVRKSLEAVPNTLIKKRQGFVTTGGAAMVDEEVEISDVRGLVRYLPRTLVVALLTPFPGQWFGYSGSTGRMRLAAAAEMILIYVLLLSMGGGAWALVRRRERGGSLLLIFVLVMMVQLGFVMVNVGTLFRHRLLFLLPLLIVASNPDGLMSCQRLWRLGVKNAESRA